MAYIGRYVGTDKTTKTLKLDTIQSQFNGSQTVFSLRSDNVAVYPPVPQSLVISLNGVVQEPTTAYTVSADTITFSPAPATNTAFFGVLNGGQVDIGTFYAVGDATIAGRATFSNTVSVTGAVNALSTVGVTGTFSALGQLSVTGNATFDTSTLFVDATNDRVSIGATAQTAFGLTVGAYGSSTAGNRGIFAGTSVLGASGGGYGSVGYNVRYTSTSNSYSYAFTDVASLLVFDDGFTFKRAASGTGGNAITFSDFMRIDSVGTIIQQGAFSTGTEALAIRNTSSGAVGNIARQNFYLSNSFDGGPTNSARIEAVSTNAGARDTDLRFWTASGSSAIAERMRITSGGNLAIGATAKLYLDGVAATGDTYLSEEAANVLRVTVGGTSQVQWDTTGMYLNQAPPTTASAANAFVNSTSDYLRRSTSSIRYKHEIESLNTDDAIVALMAMRPVTYRGKNDDDQRRFVGFIAEEMAQIAPLLCTYDEGGESGTPNYVTYDRVTAYLVAVVQKQQTQINTLKAELAALKG